jgi:hypothetical protein
MTAASTAARSAAGAHRRRFPRTDVFMPGQGNRGVGTTVPPSVELTTHGMPCLRRRSRIGQ